MLQNVWRIRRSRNYFTEFFSKFTKFFSSSFFVHFQDENGEWFYDGGEYDENEGWYQDTDGEWYYDESLVGKSSTKVEESGAKTKTVANGDVKKSNNVAETIKTNDTSTTSGATNGDAKKLPPRPAGLKFLPNFHRK